MTDDEWEKQRQRSILAAFQTGRPVFGDSEGVLRYVDGDHETVPPDIGVAKQPVPQATAIAKPPIPQATLAVQAERASHWAFVTSIVAASISAISGLIWHPWHLAISAGLVGCAVVWRRLNRHQRTSNAQERDVPR